MNLLAYWPQLAALTIISTLLVSVWLQREHNKLLKAENSSLQTQLAASQGSLKQLQFSIDEQNTAIDKLKHEADARVSSYTTELAAAKITRKKADLQANTILEQVAPAGVSKCDAANELINGELK